MDLANYEGRQFLILTDQFSGFPHICECGKHATTKQVTDFITLFISTYSAPVVIYSDGGPQFKDEFDDFCTKLSIKHITSSPHYPQSNGVAESAVKEMNENYPGRV
jgi:transposase InsO family protein